MKMDIIQRFLKFNKYKNFKFVTRSNIYKSNFVLNWSIPKNTSLSIFIPIKDKLYLLKNCLNSIKKYPPEIPYEIIIIDNGSKDIETIQFLENYEIDSDQSFTRKLIKIPGEFNYSALNNKAARISTGNVFLLLNNDIEFITPNWSNELVSNCLRPGIGFVGAKLLYEDNSIQHAGVIIGIGGVAGHAHKYFSDSSSGFQNRLILQQEFSALTAACLAVSYENWIKLGGLDEKNLKINYNDVDICLRAREIGLRNLYLPQVKARHFESKSRGKPTGKFYRQWRKEYRFMRRKWIKVINEDPMYNPNLTLTEENFSIKMSSIENLKYRINNF